MQSLNELLKEADSYKEKRTNLLNLNIDKQKEGNLDLKEKIIYNSNALEGNSLSFLETKRILETGIILDDKEETNRLEVIGHSAAFDFMLTISQKPELSITKENVLELHRLLYEKIDSTMAGKIRTTSTTLEDGFYTPPKSKDLDHLLSHFSDQIESSKYSLHPIELAALAHKRFLDMYPFEKGNGQVARLIMNLILLHAGYGLVIIPLEKKSDYVNALITSRKLYNPDPITRIIAECLLEAGREYFTFLTKNTDI